MGENESSDPGSHVFPEEIISYLGDEETSPSDIEVKSDEEEYPDEPEFFGDHREDKVSLNFWEITKFLYRFPESETEKPATPDSDESLLSLEVNGLVLNCRLIVGKEVINPIGNVRERIPIRIVTMSPEAIDRNGENEKYERRCHKVFYIPPPDEEHDDHDGRKDENGTEVRLEDEEKNYENKVRHVWDETVLKIAHLRLATLEEVGKIDDESEFHKLDGLEWEGKKWHIDPSSGPIVRHSDKEHEYKREESSNENMFGIFFENRIRSLDYNGKEDEAENDVRNIFEQVKIVVRIWERPLGNHERGDLKRRVHTHRTNHNHPEYDEGENDEENGIIDIFGFHRTDEKLQVFSKNYLDIYSITLGSNIINNLVINSILMKIMSGAKSIPANVEGMYFRTVSYIGIVIDWMNLGRKLIRKSTNHESITSTIIIHSTSEKKISKAKIIIVIEEKK